MRREEGSQSISACTQRVGERQAHHTCLRALIAAGREKKTYEQKDRGREGVGVEREMYGCATTATHTPIHTAKTAREWKERKKRATVRDAKIKDKIIKMQQSHVQEKVQKKLKRDKTRSTSRGGGERSYTHPSSPKPIQLHSTPERRTKIRKPQHTQSPP